MWIRGTEESVDLAARYANMHPDDIKLDRYAKFRKLGQYEEYAVKGGKWREARKARKEVRLLLSCPPQAPPRPA